MDAGLWIISVIIILFMVWWTSAMAKTHHEHMDVLDRIIEQNKKRIQSMEKNLEKRRKNLKKRNDKF
jgi:hypothetical protein